MGIPGNEPEECARDYIKNYYYYYPSGVYWYDASNELLLETSVKSSHEVSYACDQLSMCNGKHLYSMCKL